MDNLKVVVDRSKWLRGESSDYSVLCREEDKKMCCLGFVAIAEGLRQKDIENVDCPVYLYDYIKYQGHMVQYNEDTGAGEHTEGIREAMDINDEESMDDETREKLLKLEGQRFGVDFEFIN